MNPQPVPASSDAYVTLYPYQPTLWDLTGSLPYSYSGYRDAPAIDVTVAADYTPGPADPATHADYVSANQIDAFGTLDGADTTQSYACGVRACTESGCSHDWFFNPALGIIYCHRNHWNFQRAEYFSWGPGTCSGTSYELMCEKDYYISGMAFGEDFDMIENMHDTDGIFSVAIQCSDPRDRDVVTEHAAGTVHPWGGSPPSPAGFGEDCKWQEYIAGHEIAYVTKPSGCSLLLGFGARLLWDSYADDCCGAGDLTSRGPVTIDEPVHPPVLDADGAPAYNSRTESYRLYEHFFQFVNYDPSPPSPFSSCAISPVAWNILADCDGLGALDPEVNNVLSVSDGQSVAAVHDPDQCREGGGVDGDCCSTVANAACADDFLYQTGGRCWGTPGQDCCFSSSCYPKSTAALLVTTDPVREYSFSLCLEAVFPGVTLTTAFTVNVHCSSDPAIVINTPDNFQVTQTHWATNAPADIGEFVWDSFETTTSACQVESYTIDQYDGAVEIADNFPTGLVNILYAEAPVSGVVNADSFQLTPTDGAEVRVYRFYIIAYAMGGDAGGDNSLTTPLLSLEIICPTFTIPTIPSPQVIYLDTDEKWTFAEFTCSTGSSMAYSIASDMISLAAIPNFEAPVLSSTPGIWEVGLRTTYYIVEYAYVYVRAVAVTAPSCAEFSARVIISVECGTEILTARSSPVEVVYSLNSNTGQEEYAIDLDNLFSNTKPQRCPITELKAYSDATLANPWSDDAIVFSRDGSDIGESLFQVDTTYAYRQSVYLVAETDAVFSMADHFLQLDFIVCGHEELYQVPLSRETTTFVLEQDEEMEIAYDQYSTWFHLSTSPIDSHRACGEIVRYELKKGDHCDVELDDIDLARFSHNPQNLTSNVTINTDDSFEQQEICLEAETRGGNTAYQVLRIETLEPTTAYIENVSREGQMTVKFSRFMRCPSSTQNVTEYHNWLAQINNTVLDLYVRPGEDRNFTNATQGLRQLQEGGNITQYNMSQLNFTWETTAFADDRLELQINWTDLSAISPSGHSPDQMVLHILNHTSNILLFFVSRDTGSPLVNITLESEIPLQIPTRETYEAVRSASAASGQAIKVAVQFELLVIIIFGGNIWQILGTLQTLQLIVHLPLFNVLFPENAAAYLEGLGPLATYDIFFSNLWLKSSEELEYDPNIDSAFYQMQSLEYYDNENPLTNLFTLLVILALYCAALIVLVVSWALRFKCSGKDNSCLTRSYNKLSSYAIFNAIIFITMQCSLEMLVVGILTYQKHTHSFNFEDQEDNPIEYKEERNDDPSYFINRRLLEESGPDTNSSEFSTNLAVYYIASAAVLLPLAFLYVISKSAGDQNSDEFQNRWGASLYGLKTKSKFYSRAHASYICLYILRRIGFLILVFTLSAYACVQIIGGVYLALFMVMYKLHYMPFNSPFRNRFKVYNECVVLMATGNLIFFTGYLDKFDLHFGAGWIFICTISSWLFIQALTLLYEVVYRLALLYYRYDNRYDIASRLKDCFSCRRRKARIQKLESFEIAGDQSVKGKRRKSSILTKKLANRIRRLAPTYNGGWQNPLERQLVIAWEREERTRHRLVLTEHWRGQRAERDGAEGHGAEGDETAEARSRRRARSRRIAWVSKLKYCPLVMTWERQPAYYNWEEELYLNKHLWGTRRHRDVYVASNAVMNKHYNERSAFDQSEEPQLVARNALAQFYAARSPEFRIIKVYRPRPVVVVKPWANKLRAQTQVVTWERRARYRRAPSLLILRRNTWAWKLAPQHQVISFERPGVTSQLQNPFSIQIGNRPDSSQSQAADQRRLVRTIKKKKKRTAVNIDLEMDFGAEIQAAEVPAQSKLNRTANNAGPSPRWGQPTDPFQAGLSGLLGDNERANTSQRVRTAGVGGEADRPTQRPQARTDGQVDSNRSSKRGKQIMVSDAEIDDLGVLLHSAKVAPQAAPLHNEDALFGKMTMGSPSEPPKKPNLEPYQDPSNSPSIVRKQLMRAAMINTATPADASLNSSGHWTARQKKRPSSSRVIGRQDGVQVSFSGPAGKNVEGAKEAKKDENGHECLDSKQHAEHVKGYRPSILLKQQLTGWQKKLIQQEMQTIQQNLIHLTIVQSKYREELRKANEQGQTGRNHARRKQFLERELALTSTNINKLNEKLAASAERNYHVL